jgi:hypothetical protein
MSKADSVFVGQIGVTRCSELDSSEQTRDENSGWIVHLGESLEEKMYEIQNSFETTIFYISYLHLSIYMTRVA